MPLLFNALQLILAPMGAAAPSSGDGEKTGSVSSRDEGECAMASPPKAKGGHRPGTGRLGAAAYVGAERIECRHEELAVGQRCPVCGQGNLYALPAGVEIRLDGNALLSAIQYDIEKLRCSACGEIFTAGLPEGVGDEKYSARARAVLAVSRYVLGVPSYRLQGYQAMLGVPVPDSTQWDQIEVVGDCAYKVFEQMEHEAAQGELIFQDDTAVRILSLMQENRVLLEQAEAQGLSSPKERTGMHTTALAVQVGTIPPSSTTPAAAMRVKTFRPCWTNVRRAWPNRWPCPMPCRVMKWPTKRC
jgi:Transposase IS66 family